MKHFFQNAVSAKEYITSLATVLTKAWLQNKPGSEELLFKLLKKSPKARAEALSVVTHHSNLIKNAKLSTKCVRILKVYMNSVDKEIVHKYSVAFLHFEPDMFDVLFPLLKLLSQANVFKNSPKYFCDYLLKSCNKRTVYSCIELISDFDKLYKTDISQGNYYDSEPLSVVLSIYNILGNTQKDSVFKERCMDMFDAMLMQPEHRNAAHKAMELVEK